MASNQLTYHQVFDLAYKAGWRKSGDIERVGTIVQAESSRIPTKENYCCVGLMAINVLVHKQYTREQMKDPEANMRAGFALWQSEGWRPWNSSRGGQLLAGPLVRANLETWTWSPGVGEEGTKGAIGEAVKAVTNVSVPGLSGVVGAAEKARAWLTTPANLGRLALGILAGAVIVAGVVVLILPTVKETIREVRPV